MANDYFQFKQFNIRQEKCAMKVGTDGVLLGSWVAVESCSTILDVGTGTGVIALMLAQRSKALIDAIDIDREAVEQAAENISSSVFAGRMEVFHASLADYATKTGRKYDLIVSNPPYFDHSLKSPDNKKNLARHTDTLPLAELISVSKSLLTQEGRIAVILPSQRGEDLMKLIKENGLSVIRRTDVQTTPHVQPKRFMVELSADATLCTTDSLAIEENGHQYTEAYIRLTKDFYLNM